MCAFVECTMTQAEAHAREVVDRLGMSVMPMTVDDIAGRENRVPRHISVLLTTYFHSAQLMPLCRPGQLEVVVVPVEVSPQLVEQVRPSSKILILLEEEQQTAKTVADDAGRILNCPPLEIKVTTDIRVALAELLKPSGSTGASETFALVSPREWDRMGQRWRNHPNVHLVPFRIHDEAWDLIADVVGMPLGALG